MRILLRDGVRQRLKRPKKVFESSDDIKVRLVVVITNLFPKQGTQGVARKIVWMRLWWIRFGASSLKVRAALTLPLLEERWFAFRSS